jgi:aryl-alcohol dehydrogenase-like predicted oxidoreductase
MTVSDDLAFGCSTLMAHETQEQALQVLAQASELGIVHFDTASGYGAGESERILGKHLRGRRDATIITTKYGLVPPSTSPILNRGYARAASSGRFVPAVQGLRRIRRALRPSMFSPAKIRASLESSLTALGTDYVDYFLLHEATAADARRRSVTRTLEKLAKEGKIRDFGIGSAYARIGPEEASIPSSYRVLQFEHSPLASSRIDEGLLSRRRVFTHSAVASMPRLLALVAREPELCRKHAAMLGLDVADPTVLPGLLLAYSHGANPSGRVIFSTRSRDRLVDNVTAFAEIKTWPCDRVLAMRRFMDELAATAT